MRPQWFGGRKRPVGEVDWARHVRDDAERSDRVLWALIGVNVLVWAAWNGSASWGLDGLRLFLAEHFLVNAPGVLQGRVWTLFTSEISHFDLGHMGFNMVGLYIFGRAVGRALGPAHLLQLYVVGGIVASLGHTVFNLVTGDVTPALGASGAVMALAAVYAALFPDREILFSLVLPMPAWMLVAVYILVDLAGLMGVGHGVANAAHLGGAAYGLAFWYFRLRRPPRPRFEKGTYGTRL